MHEVTVRSTLVRPLVALGAACMKLMRIIPDNEPGYSDTLVTVKRYLLDGAASAFVQSCSGLSLPSLSLP